MEPGALPLLEDTLDLLWQRRDGRVLTQQAYKDIGGIAGALQGRANALIDKLSPDEQRMARRLLLRLVNIGQDPQQGTRRRVAQSKLRPTDKKDAALFDAVVSQMVDARLLVTDQDGTEQRIEVAHEALIRKWTRLHDWVRAAGKRLLALEEFDGWVKQWELHGTLLIKEQLEHAEKLAKLCDDELGAKAHELLEASQALRNSNQRWREVFFAFGIFMLLSVVGNLFRSILVRKDPFEGMFTILAWGAVITFGLIVYVIYLALRSGWRLIFGRSRGGPTTE